MAAGTGQTEQSIARGWRHPVGPLSVIDDYSRYLIVLSATGSTYAAAVREQLEHASVCPKPC